MGASDERANPGEQLLAPEITELLLELSLGVHRYAMYPAGHPSLENVAESVHERFRKAFASRYALTVTVLNEQLEVEGAASDPSHPVLSDLARRLHDHQLGALSVEPGITLDQVESLLERLSQDVERGYEPLGLLDESRMPSWAHVRLFPVGYGALHMRDTSEPEDVEDDRATQLWMRLAKSALATDEVTFSEADPVRIAEGLKGKQSQEANDDVVGSLLQLTAELQGRPREEAVQVREHLAHMIDALDPETVQRVVEMGGDTERRRRFVLNASESLAFDPVLKLVQAAADAEHQNVSTLLMRLLTKLSRHVDTRSGKGKAGAETELRDSVNELLTQWDLEDPNPGGYSMVLDGMATATPELSGTPRGQEVSGALRVLQMAVEVDAWGRTVETALEALVKNREIVHLLDLAESADEGSELFQRLDAELDDPRQFQQLLIEDVLDDDTIARLTGHQTDPVDPLLKVLAEADSRSLRRRVFNQLAGMGPEVAARVLPYLGDDRWFVLRNMLALLNRFGEPPQGFEPGPFVDHPDVRVRREAFPLAVANESTRARALSSALADSDERLVQMALKEAAKGVAASTVPTILNRFVRDASVSPSVQAAAIGVLRGAPLTMARDALMEVTLKRGWLPGARELKPSSPQVLAALSVLADTWCDDPEVQKVLQKAQKSKDAAIRAALASGEPS